MTNDLVTIASFASPVEAELAKNCLESSGIPTFLVGENTVSMAWHLTNAVGGIRLQVAQSDATEAVAILHNPVEEDVAEGNQEEVDDEGPLPTVREQNADRALRAAILGLLFWPLELYVSWLLLKVLLSEERLASAQRRKAILATVINLPLLSVPGLLLRAAAVS